MKTDSIIHINLTLLTLPLTLAVGWIMRIEDDWLPLVVDLFTIPSLRETVIEHSGNPTAI